MVLSFLSNNNNLSSNELTNVSLAPGVILTKLQSKSHTFAGQLRTICTAIQPQQYQQNPTGNSQTAKSGLHWSLKQKKLGQKLSPCDS